MKLKNCRNSYSLVATLNSQYIKICMAGFTISNFLLLLLLSTPANSAKPEPEINPLATKSCGPLRTQMTKFLFKKIALDKYIDQELIEDAFEATALLSMGIKPNSKKLNPQGSKFFTAPNIGGKIVLDGVLTSRVKIKQDNRTISELESQDSTLVDVKFGVKVNYSDPGKQIKKYLDYLANASPASKVEAGDFNPVPHLIFITSADTEIVPRVREVASDPTRAEPRYTTGNQRRVAVWQLFACNPSIFDKTLHPEAVMVVGEPVLLNPEIKTLDGNQNSELYVNSGNPVDIPPGFVLASKSKNKKFQGLTIPNPRTDIAGVIITKPSDPDPTPPPSGGCIPTFSNAWCTF